MDLTLRMLLYSYFVGILFTHFFDISVRNQEDIENDETSFGPDMCHQVFGENENIFGYTDLHIRLYYSAGSLQTYLGIEYTDKVWMLIVNSIPICF